MTAPADAPVVVGIDDSSLSLAAVRLAAQEAAAQHRPLTVLHAFNWAAVETEPGGRLPREAAEELIDRAVATASEIAPDLAVHGELAEGPAVASLVRHSERAALVALGDGDLAGCGCVPWDAPAVQVAARAGSPVLVVRRTPPPADGPVLVGVDGSSSADAALAYAFDCADRRHTELLVVRVTDPDRRDGDLVDRLAEDVARWHGGYPGVPVRQEVLAGEASQVLLDRSRAAALAVVGARGSDPTRGMLGEVSQSLLYHSPAPVIVVRAHAVSRRARRPGGAAHGPDASVDRLGAMDRPDASVDRLGAAHGPDASGGRSGGSQGQRAPSIRQEAPRGRDQRP
ncbi:universal stress protein [Micromonospora echinofusca]|uniref:Universal stress protein n=1 Tax=Micromonospora echinofusca TaxID=47858 RepID=A0ABS3VXZ3_MICEH|nr:universal stress protein [Micromonospora echinofusca]MBO4209223.1 universal stress protein [Micromonospora echinofusca]